MKNTYLRCAVTLAFIGFLGSTSIVKAQSGAAGAGAGGGATGAAAGGAAASSGAPVGGASIVKPSAPAAGGASAIQANPNTVGGNINSGGISANPANATPGATLPSGVPAGTPAIPFNTLPPSVQGALRNYSASGALGSVTPVSGRAGTYRATVTQNGVPMELILAANGQVISRAPVSGSATATAGNSPTDAGALANAQAGIPLNSLPPTLQSSIQSQLGGATVQSISREDVGNGSVLRVTTLQNGVPTEMRFAANGTLISATPVTGTAGTGNVATVPGGTIVPGAVVIDDLPSNVQAAVRTQLGGANATRIVAQRGPAGMSYVVSYDQNGRPMTMVVGPDGRVVSNAPVAGNAEGINIAAARSSSGSTNAASRTTMMKLDELPDNIESALKKSAPNAEVRTISREQRVGGDVYVVAVRDGDRAGEITLDANGKVIRDTRRDLSAVNPQPPLKANEKPQGIPYERLPVAIQNAVKAYAAASDIRTITLGSNRDGRTIYDVIFYRDGRRDRMILGKDGTLIRIEENVPAALELASDKPAVLAMGDLPQVAQDTIRRQTDHVRVREIKSKQVGNEWVYQVKYETNGAPVELLVSQDGTVILAEGEAGGERAPIQARLDTEEKEEVRVVEATPIRPSRSNSEIAAGAGAAATRERGAASTVTPGENTATSKVNLKDTPQAVQATARKLTGTGTIESITPKINAGGVGYEVSFTQNGKTRTVVLDRNGVEQPEDSPTPLK